MDQDCSTTQISCELRKIAGLLSEPDLFDYLSGIVVPVILGVATLILAVFTISTARRANDLQVELEKRRQAREDRAARRAIVTDLIEWAGFELVTFPGKERPELQEARKVVRAHRQRLGEPTLDTLQGWVRKRIETFQTSIPGEPRHRGPSETYSEISDVIEKWAEEPESVAARSRSDAMRSALDAALADFERITQEAVTKAAEALRKADERKPNAQP